MGNLWVIATGDRVLLGYQSRGVRLFESFKRCFDLLIMGTMESRRFMKWQRLKLQRLDDRIKEIQNEVCQQKKVVRGRFRKMMRSMLLGRRMTVLVFGRHRTNAAFDKAKEAYMESKALLEKAKEKAINVVDEKYTFIFRRSIFQCNFDGRIFFAIQGTRATLVLDIRNSILADDVAEFMT